MSGGKATGTLVRAALRYLRKAKRRAGARAQAGAMRPERLRHTLLGERDGRASGWHHRPGGVDPPGAKFLRETRRDHRTGVYEGRVAMQDRRTGEWREKRDRSTFFPDDWTPAQVDNAITRGFREGARLDPNTGTWTSTFRGISLRGYYDPATGALQHGFPVLPRNLP